MSEIIKRIEQEKLAQKASTAAETERQRIINNKRVAEERQRDNFVAQGTQTILKQGNIVEHFEKIRNKLLSDGEIVEISEHGRRIVGLSLCWNFNSERDRYSYVSAIVNPDSQTLTIYGREAFTLSGRERKNTTKVEGIIAKAFLNPGNAFPEEPDIKSDIGGGR